MKTIQMRIKTKRYATAIGCNVIMAPRGSEQVVDVPVEYVESVWKKVADGEIEWARLETDGAA